MKKVLFVLPIVLFILVAFAFAAEQQKMEFKSGVSCTFATVGTHAPVKPSR